MTRPQRLSLLLLAVAALALLEMGALKARRDFLTRGIPPGMPQPILGGGVRLGVSAELRQYSAAALEGQLGRMRDAGILYVKQTFNFVPDFNWQESDRLLAQVGQAGLRLVPLLDGDPATHFAPPADPNAFAAWAAEFARRYGEQLDSYIIWDEPNLASHWGNRPVNPAEYAALLAAASQVIRRQDSNALIVAAPLAPTTETGPSNLADPLYLQRLYEAGAAPTFDVVAGKPYGFDSGPDDRAVHLQVLNFSRIILLREVMLRNGDQGKGIWAGNWGWNALPPDWSGQPSIWGQTDEATQAAWTLSALERARREWPWMGRMFLENWEPASPADDPRWGFSLVGKPLEAALLAAGPQPDVAFPGFHLAQPDDPAQSYRGKWRFSPQFGADIGQTDDAGTFRFYGTDVALRVRRANFRARLYVTVDGQPANALPRTDDNRPTLVLSAADPAEDYLASEIVARRLPPGVHELSLVAYRGWDQWALNGYSVAYHPPDGSYRLAQTTLALLALAAALLAGQQGWKAGWLPVLRRWVARWEALTPLRQLFWTGLVAAVVAVSGWLTWGPQVAGVYRRLDSQGQLALVAAAAGIFYVAPSFLIYLLAVLILFALIWLRPAWGLALVAFSLPFYVVPKPMLAYRFSPVELFILVALAAALARETWSRLRLRAGAGGREARRLPLWPGRWQPGDSAILALTLVATVSLFFTARLDVASNEWRVVVVEPAIFYLLLRRTRPAPQEWWVILDAFVLGGLAVALLGLGQYVLGQNLITAELGLQRLRSVYGSPNNVALYLGRILPLLAAMLLLGSPANGRRRWAYGAALLPIGLAALLTFSKGMLFLGLPAAALVIVGYWRRGRGRRAWPWLLALAGGGLVALLLALQLPPLAARLDPQGNTGFLRLNLWRASLNMALDHPWIGVGLDNFLYQYRGRYLLDAAWSEPNLSHPHNLLLDFATRLGLPGLLAGGWLFWAYWNQARRLPERVPAAWKPVAVGLLGSLAYILAHGLVDHSFFLVDLAGAFSLLLALVAWLGQEQNPGSAT